MRKIRATILSVFALSALACLVAAGGVATATTVAFADDTHSVSAPVNGLIAPQTYEEYLQLNAPSCSAVCENYTAIADGNTIYVFDRDENLYKTYVHGTGVSQDQVKTMQFYNGNTLYFADNATGDNLYKLNAETLDVATEIEDIACGTFLIAGEDLYFTNSSGSLFATTLQDAENEQPKTSLLWNDVSSLAYYNDELYFVRSDFYLHKINPRNVETPDAQKTLFATLSQVSSMTISEGVLAYTTVSGAFQTYSLADVTESGLLFRTENEGYTSVYPFGNSVFVTQTDAGILKEYSLTQKTFSGYEISSNSSASHRLNQATDLTLYKNELFIADNGNKRLSIYDNATDTLNASFPLSAPATFIVADNENVFTASQAETLVYAKTGETLARFDTYNGAIVGIANVYGTCYVATENNYVYAIAKDELGAWQRMEVKKTSTHPPQLLTADAYGNLYIKSGANAYVFTETEFMQADGNGSKLLDSLPTDTVKLSIDYDGNLYALADGVYKYEKQADGAFSKTAIDVSERFVYGDKPTLTSLAFGIEQNATYLLCNGNYVTRTDKLQLPTVTNIPVENADESIFAETEANFEIVKIKTNALLVAFDVEKLKGAEVYPYLSYQRSQTEKTALKIGEDSKGKYNLIAHFDAQTSKYSTYLVVKNACERLSAEDYRLDYAENEQKSAWLTNELSLYKFPYLCKELIVTQSLPRGAQITLLGEIDKLDHAYYRIAYTDANGDMKTGYIPQSYATLFDASPKDSNTTLVGKEESNRDAIWRLTYILLGFGAVCILVDFLILRKKKDD